MESIQDLIRSAEAIVSSSSPPRHCFDLWRGEMDRTGRDGLRSFTKRQGKRTGPEIESDESVRQFNHSVQSIEPEFVSFFYNYEVM
ncbi:hypothetical protein GW17_00026442 [Ensete ventricosum]|nr:hypothetical protein GW17_00026442 [Ensete ventricosum]